MAIPILLGLGAAYLGRNALKQAQNMFQQPRIDPRLVRQEAAALMPDEEIVSRQIEQLFKLLGSQQAIAQNRVAEAAAYANLPAETLMAAQRGVAQRFADVGAKAKTDFLSALNRQQLDAIRFLMGIRQQENLFDAQRRLELLKQLAGLFRGIGQSAPMLLGGTGG